MAPKAALVTGGAKRIGRAIVERLAAEGYRVAIHCNASVVDAEALAQAIGAAGGRATVVQADLSDADAVAGMIAAATTALGPLDLLVNNASEFEDDRIETLDLARYQRTLAVDLTAPLILARDLAAQLPEDTEGLVVNILDQRVWKETPYFFSYQIAKSALWTATRTMARALAPRIRVNAIGPGPTLTSPRQGDEDFAKQFAAVPLRRSSSPEEVCEALIYLTRARSVTGQMIALDGGQHLAWETPDVVGIRE
ncbi:SDR family oxidoreductase [Salinarimonas ramus]|uniref:Short chain dehydrogenase n=1 Tax=Salinarimonas ramus TaxID=690164 RepID=A0A917Q576_9HYPH|nr:SDR family oxidoreductase [Salinarimonas ramus]GGK25019.1 short chain dehydrogenase [Salinarimonas ramus]